MPPTGHENSIAPITMNAAVLSTKVIDTIHLVEVARAIEILKDSSALTATDRAAIWKWFGDYLQWLTTSKNGLEEREAKNNHGTCWMMQVAAFARLIGNQELLSFCRDRFKTVLVPNQIAADGRFPEEQRRTKPYGYSLFNLDAMATACQILSTLTTTFGSSRFLMVVASSERGSTCIHI